MPPGQVGLKVYIADAGAGVGNGKILRIEIVEGDPPYEVAEELLVGLQSPAGIAFDPKTDFVYWSDETEGVIYRANATGATLVNVEVVVSGLSSPKIVRICSATDRVCGNRDKIYWTEPGDSRIGRATLSSLSVAGAATAAGDLVTGLSSPAGLSIGKNKVYWTATDTDEIGRANLGAVNSAVNFTFVDNVIDSPGISLGFQGESAKQMFWTLTDTGRGPGAIQHRNIDGDTGDGTEFTDGNPGSVTDIRVLRPGRAVPTVSTWGVVVLLLLVLAAGTVVFRPLRASPS